MTLQRCLTLVLLSHAVMLLLSSLLGILPWRVPVPQVGLLLVLYCGVMVRGSLVQLVMMGLVGGYLTDLACGAPAGLHGFSLALFGFFARLLSSRLIVGSVWQLLVVAYAASFAHGAMLVGLGASQLASSGMAAIVIVPEHALFTALVAPMMFSLFRRFDRQPVTGLQFAWR